MNQAPSDSEEARGRQRAASQELIRRNSSPGPYVHDAWARSQSPIGSVYSDGGLIPVSPRWIGDAADVPEAWLGPSSDKAQLQSPPKPLIRTRIGLSESVCPQFCCRVCSQQGRFCHHPAGDVGVSRSRELVYLHFTLFEHEIRLLRIDPGEHGSPLRCALKPIEVDKIKASVLTFQALSYAWGDSAADHFITVYDLVNVADDLHHGQPRTADSGIEGSEPPLRVLPIRKNLFEALQRIRDTQRYTWLWVDAICIDQNCDPDKSCQLPNMPHIYSNAWNVIVWLGEEEDYANELDLAVALIPELLNMDRIDSFLENAITPSEASSDAWRAFGNILQRPWFSRRWVIQELAYAKNISIRIRHHVLSWVDFLDAVDIYARHDTNEHGRGPADEKRIDCGRAMALLELSQNIFQNPSGPKEDNRTKLRSLESLVLLASSFQVSEVRDTIYALLCLCNDISATHDYTGFASLQGSDIRGDYSQHPVQIFSDFVQYSVKKSDSLDILCRPWATWPNRSIYKPYLSRILPGWIRVASFAGRSPLKRIQQSEIFLGPPGQPLYNASLGLPKDEIFVTLDGDVLQTYGVLIGEVSRVSSIVSGKEIPTDALEILGWHGKVETCFDDVFWRTLVANRNASGKTAPAWYRRTCASAFSTPGLLKPQLDLTEHGGQKIQSRMVREYLQRVAQATEGRRSFECDNNEISGKASPGIGPSEVVAGHSVAILFGCSVPVVLKPVKSLKDTSRDFRIIGPCYLHGYMEGEVFAGLTHGAIRRRSRLFRIH